MKSREFLTIEIPIDDSLEALFNHLFLVPQEDYKIVDLLIEASKGAPGNHKICISAKQAIVVGGLSHLGMTFLRYYLAKRLGREIK